MNKLGGTDRIGGTIGGFDQGAKHGGLGSAYRCAVDTAHLLARRQYRANSQLLAIKIEQIRTLAL